MFLWADIVRTNSPDDLSRCESHRKVNQRDAAPLLLTRLDFAAGISPLNRTPVRESAAIWPLGFP